MKNALNVNQAAAPAEIIEIDGIEVEGGVCCYM